MQIFVASKGERLGPFSLFRVSELLDEGELSPDDLGWHSGRDEWTPLREIPSLMSVIANKQERDFLRESSKPLDLDAGNEVPSGEGDESKNDDDEVPIEPAPNKVRSPDELRAAASSAAAAGAFTAGKPHPFARFWARIFDYLLVVLVVYAVVGPPPLPGIDGTATITDLMQPGYWDQVREATEGPEFRRVANAHIAAMVLWTLLEGLLLAQFGTTPGKWLFAIKVTDAAGRRLSTQHALLRSLFVWFAGVGMWVFLISIGTMLFGLYCLMTRGATLWDRHLSTRVHHGNMTAPRIVLAIVAFFAILIAQQALALR